MQPSILAYVSLLGASLLIFCAPASASPIQGCSTSIDGIVWQDTDCDGVFSPASGDFVLPGVEVYLLGYKFFPIDQVTTDSSGAYAFTGLCPETYGIQVETSTLPPDLVPTLFNVGDPQFDSQFSPAGFGFLDNEQVHDIDFGYKPGCTAEVRGAVWNDLANEGLQNPTDPGISGVVLNLLDTAGALVASTTTDPAGDYRFEEVCEGNYSIVVDESTLPAGFVAGTICNISNNAFEHIDNDCSPFGIDLASGELRTDVDFAYFKSDLTAFCFADQGDCPCGNNDPAGGCQNQTGFGATLDATGSASITADDLVLATVGVPAGQYGVIIMGVTPARAAFGNGLRCLAVAGIVRLRPALQADSFGTVFLGPGLLGEACSQVGACIQPGDRRYFQLWYRDAIGTCGMDSNFTNAVEVCFRL